MKKFGFTLAEIMIVLTIIGVLTMILLPIANHSRPDENVMKFKKADTTLKNVIKELVTSDKYYCNGDLAIKNDCKTYVDVTYDEETGGDTYFCNTIADLLSVKENKCRKSNSTGSPFGAYMLSNADPNTVQASQIPIKITVTEETIKKSQEQFDKSCKISAARHGAEIITPDNVSYFQVSNRASFSFCGNLSYDSSCRFYSPPDKFPANIGDQNGFDIVYKVYCIDVDGIPDNATETDCVNECPFGYGIRADGKIMPGARAAEWLEKGFQKGKNE